MLVILAYYIVHGDEDIVNSVTVAQESSAVMMSVGD